MDRRFAEAEQENGNQKDGSQKVHTMFCYYVMYDSLLVCNEEVWYGMVWYGCWSLPAWTQPQRAEKDTPRVNLSHGLIYSFSHL